MDLIEFSNTLPPDSRNFEVFEVVWCKGEKYTVTWYTITWYKGINYLWLYKLNSFEPPFKVDSRLVKKVIRAN